MKKIAVISDTHGLLREEVIEKIKECDLIIHAGDINTQKIVDELKELKPLYIVRGNNDKEWAEGIPVYEKFEIEGFKFYVVHNKKDFPKELEI